VSEETGGKYRLANDHIANESPSKTNFSYDQCYQPLLSENRVETERQTFVPPRGNCFEGDGGQEVAESGDQKDEVASCPQVMLTRRWGKGRLRRGGEGTCLGGRHTS